jgi:hypothetical protein
VLTQPRDEGIKTECVLFIQVEDKAVGFPGIRRQVRAVYGEKGIGGCEGGAFVAVDERVVLRQTLPRSARAARGRASPQTQERVMAAAALLP